MSKQITPRRYQERTKEAFKAWMTDPSSNNLSTIILPTGCGKTITAALCLSEVPGAKVLWTAHREELITQGRDALQLIMPNRSISVEMAENKADPTSDIVVGSVATLARNRKHFQEFEPDIIVIDEYHHYSEENVQYDGLLKRFPKARVLGLTATPWRFSGDNLPLGDVLMKMDIGVAVEKGYLVQPVGESLISQVSLADVKTRMGDFDIKGLSAAVNVESRNQMIAKRVIEMVRDAKRQGILFSVDVAHSKAMHALLKNEVRVAEVYGETPIEERRAIMAAIRNGEVDVLCNNLVATEGFDVPHLSFIMITRPTRSLGLFIQMAGRGLRTFDGKTDCIITDVYDKIKARQSRVTFKDMAVSGDIYGDRRRAVSSLAAEAPVDIAKRLVHFPIMIRPDKEERWHTDDDSFPVTSWSVSPDQWIVTWTKENKVQKTIQKTIWAPFKDVTSVATNVLVMHKTFGDGYIKSIAERGDNPKVLVVFGWGDERLVLLSHLQCQTQIKEELPDEFDVTKTDRLFYICNPETEKLGRIIFFERDKHDLILKGDKRLSKNDIQLFLETEAKQDGVLPLVRTSAKWKRDVASDGQKKFISGLGRRIGFDLDFESLTKGEASSVIEQNKWQKIIVDKFGTNFKNKLLGYDQSTEDV